MRRFGEFTPAEADTFAYVVWLLIVIGLTLRGAYRWWRRRDARRKIDHFR